MADFKLTPTLSVGAPIPVERVEQPSQDDIDALHVKYCSSLVKLFDEHKASYGIKEGLRLRIY